MDGQTDSGGIGPLTGQLKSAFSHFLQQEVARDTVIFWLIWGKERKIHSVLEDRMCLRILDQLKADGAFAKNVASVKGWSLVVWALPVQLD